MAATNAIGTGAVILTANADRLLAGLDRAENATAKWARDTSRVVDGISEKANRRAYEALVGKGAQLGKYLADVDYTKPMKEAKDKADEGAGKGGLMGKLLFGAGVGVALAGVALVAHALGKLVERLAEVGERAKQYGNIDAGRLARIDRFQTGFDRISAAADDLVFRVAERLGPTIERVATVLEVTGFAIGEVFGAIAEEIEDGAAALTKWLSAIVGTDMETKSLGKTTFDILRVIAKGVAFVWDVVLARTGAVATVAGKIIQAYGRVLVALGEVSNGMDEAIAKLPAFAKIGLFGVAGANLNGGFKEAGERIEKIGDGFSAWGAKAVAGFGSALAKVDPLFDRLQAMFDATERIQKGGGAALSGAFS
ncbi:MAG TPA: hypothetical protein VGE74_30155, partial [Gemmata sp.]